MKKIKIYMVVGITLCALLACSENKEQANKSAQPNALLPESSLKTLEQAKGVEQLLQDSDEQRRKQLESE